jgi:WD40 repeat protein
LKWIAIHAKISRMVNIGVVLLFPVAAARNAPKFILHAGLMAFWFAASIAFGQYWLAELPQPLAGDMLELKKYWKGMKSDYAAIDTVGRELLAKYADPKDQAEIYFNLAYSYMQGNSVRPDTILEYGKKALELPLPLNRRMELCRFMGIAAYSAKRGGGGAERARAAADYYLTGIEELDALKLSAAPPEPAPADVPPDLARLRIEQKHRDALRARESADYKSSLQRLQKNLISSLSSMASLPNGDAALEATIQRRLQALDDGTQLKNEYAAAVEKLKASRAELQAKLAKERAFQATFSMTWTIAFSPDGQLLAMPAGMTNTSGGEVIQPGELVVWDVAANKIRWIGRQDVGIRCAAFSADGKILAIGDFMGEHQFLDAATGKLIARLPRHGGVINAVAFLPDKKTYVSSGFDGAVKLWDLATRKLKDSFVTPGEMVNSLGASADGQWLAAGTRQGSLYVWNIPARKVAHNKKVSSDIVETLALAPDGKSIATSAAGKVVLWEAASGRQLREFTGHLGPVNILAFSADGKKLAGIDGAGRIVVWNPAAGEPSTAWPAQRGDSYGLQFSADGRYLASTSLSGNPKLWDAASQQLVAELPRKGDADMLVVDLRVRPGETLIEPTDSLNPTNPPAIMTRKSLWLAAAIGTLMVVFGVVAWVARRRRKDPPADAAGSIPLAEVDE